jgi:anti-sigma B factor antagonist
VARRDESEAGFEGLREAAVKEIASDDGRVVVYLAGELDLYNAPEVRQALIESSAGKPSRMVVDLSAVVFIDSTALGVLVEARARLGPGAFVLAAPGRETRRALEISGLDRHFAVRDSVDEALATDLG